MKPLPRMRVISTLALCTASSIVCAAGILAPRPASAPPPIPSSPVANVQRVPASDAPPASSVVQPEPRAALMLPSKAQADKSVQSPDAAGQTPAEIAAPLAAAAHGSGPDFSGHWSLVSSTYAGRGRGGSGGGAGERKVTAKWASGAPVNCGPECTISQDAKTLTISRLGTPDAVTFDDKGMVVLRLDGSDSPVTRSSGSQYVVHANWDGDKLVVKFDYVSHTATQVLSIVDGQLKVVTDFGLGDAPVTLTYAKG